MQKKKKAFVYHSVCLELNEEYQVTLLRFIFSTVSIHCAIVVDISVTFPRMDLHCKIIPMEPCG